MINITSINGSAMIDYDDSTHTYTFRGRRYLSATQVLEKYAHTFDTEEQSKLYADKAGKDAEYWQKEWANKGEVARQRGNQLHDLREEITRARGIDTAFGRPHTVRNIDLYPTMLPLRELPDGIYPEMKLWSHQHRVAGRADKIILETYVNDEGWDYSNGFPDEIRIAHIQDYKTNKFIRARSFTDPITRTPVMMKEPLTHLEDCAMNHYKLQVSLYQYMLEEQGFEPGVRELIHFPRKLDIAPPGAKDPAPVTYPCPYLRNEVISLLHHLNENYDW